MNDREAHERPDRERASDARETGAQEHSGETGTGWPDEADEPQDLGWPDVTGEVPVAVDDVPAGVTITPAEHEATPAEHETIPDERHAGQDRPEAATPGRPGAATRKGTEASDRDGPEAVMQERFAEQTVDLSPARARRGSGPRRQRLTAAGGLIGVLVALLGFALAVQFRSHTADPELASARQEDLVRILSDLEARQERTRQEISDLEERQRQLTSGARGRQAALDEATQRADELGILAGTLPAQGPGLTVRFQAGREPVRADAVLDAIQELRGAGAEAMQVAGDNGVVARVVAATYVVDAPGGIEVDGKRLTGVYTITVIGDGQTMRTALNIAGGVVESVQQAGGNVSVQDPGTVRVTALHTSAAPRYARPAK